MGCGGCKDPGALDFTEENSALLVNTFITEHLPKYPFPEHPVPRGIVICAGGRGLLANAWVCIRILRMHGCKLPIQVWYLGVREYDQHWDHLIKRYDVEMMDAHAFLEKYPHRSLNGWELKVYAMMLCPYKEVILLDADNVAVRDPEYLFETEEFQKTGAILWPDYGRLGRKRAAWKVFDVNFRDEPEVESGQVVMDVVRHSAPLIFANWVMNYSPWFFRHVHGDKEVFHLCWRKMKYDYSMPKRPIHSLPGTMCQHDFKGERVFQHRNMKKWTLGGNAKVHDFYFEKECLEFLDELRRFWDPLTKFTEHLTDEDKAQAAEMVGLSFRYYRVGHDDRIIRLGKDTLISFGADRKESYWWMHKDELYICGDDLSLTCKLIKCGEFWVGRWVEHEKMPILLVPHKPE